jgi:uncharacterized protein (TIGR03435 family)
MSSLMVLSKNIPWASASLLSIVMAATIGIVGAHGVFAQSRLPPDSAFAVASVKVSKATDFRREEIKFLPGGRVVATNYPLQVLIAGAYHLPYQSPRLIGGPEWLRSDRYDIEAKADGESLPTGLPSEVKRARMRLMLQKLLADRFKLMMRRETKELPVYVMVVAKNGLKLQKSKIEERDCFNTPADVPNDPANKPVSCHALLGGQGFGLHGQAIDMSDLAVYVENYADRPVIDKSGVEGLFQIDTTGWIPLRKPPAPGAKAENGADLDTMPSLFAVFAGLGLKLESQRVPIEILIIEHVERPTEN